MYVDERLREGNGVGFQSSIRSVFEKRSALYWTSRRQRKSVWISCVDADETKERTESVETVCWRRESLKRPSCEDDSEDPDCHSRT